MIYRAVADFILIGHLFFVLFAVFGGWLVLYRRAVLRLHLPALAWGIAVELFQLPCPLTALENLFRRLGGDAGYDGGFVEHYASLILYSNITPTFQILLGVLLAAVNLFIYTFVFRRRASNGGI